MPPLRPHWIPVKYVLEDSAGHFSPNATSTAVLDMAGNGSITCSVYVIDNGIARMIDIAFNFDSPDEAMTWAEEVLSNQPNPEGKIS